MFILRNFLGLEERFGEYPKLKNVVRMKDEVIRSTNTPPTYLHADLRKFNLSEIGLVSKCFEFLIYFLQVCEYISISVYLIFFFAFLNNIE